MRISLERSGGFAGIRLTTTVDTDSLADDEARTLQQLVESSDFFHLPATLMPQKPQPDRFQYTLTVETDDKSHTVTAAETALPAKARPLFEWLAQRARRA